MRTYNTKDCVFFSSNARMPFNKLANFNACMIRARVWVTWPDGSTALMEMEFPSAEHYWWAHFLEKEQDIRRLAKGGDLATLEIGFRTLGLSEEMVQKKTLYWDKKDNVGIVAKMLRKRASSINISMRDHIREEYGPPGSRDALVDVWTKILTDKYSQNKAHRKILSSTEGKKLVERDNRAKSTSLWGAKALPVEGRPGRVSLVGVNFMGNLLGKRIR
jgi:predicted NAD-dependent protein-ADP-ribosyltransferase YbiA (DUF1768 family)